MKHSPVVKKVNGNMQPGIITIAGFIGNDSRSISDIIEADEKTMQKLNLSFDELVSKMRAAMEAAKKGLGDWITIDTNLEARIDEARGRLACPYEDGAFPKINVTVKKKSSEKKIIYSELTIHLIEKHHFFQGSGAVFRNEPADIAQILFK